MKNIRSLWKMNYFGLAVAILQFIAGVVCFVKGDKLAALMWFCYAIASVALTFKT